jgi:hypothetical protein
VLTVPVTALSVGADGDARLQVEKAGRTNYVQVTPGLAAQGLVEVSPVSGDLTAGDLVVAGTKDGSPVPGAATGTGTSQSSGTGTTSQAGKGSTGGTGSSGSSGSSGASGGSGSSGTSGQAGGTTP